jgi:acetyl esterase/lipase
MLFAVDGIQGYSLNVLQVTHFRRMIPMLIEKVKLWDDNEFVYLHAYILENLQEFQTGKERPSVIICPGGGYFGTSDREAEPVALRFANLGYQAFVLRYTTYFNEPVKDITNRPTPNERWDYQQPLFDLTKAIITIRENASRWFVDTEKIALVGFSAGAHLVASLGVHWNSNLLREKFNLDGAKIQPNAVILGYPLLDYLLMKDKLEKESNEFVKGFWDGHNSAVFGTTCPSQEQLIEFSPVNYVSSQTPPTFIWHTANDDLVYAENSLKFALELAKHKVPYELHVFETGVHGLSLCDETTAGDDSHINPYCKVWFDLASNWLKKHFK